MLLAQEQGTGAGGGSAYTQNMQRVAVNDIIEEVIKGEGGLGLAKTLNYLNYFYYISINLSNYRFCILWLHAHAACVHSNWIKRAQVVARARERESTAPEERPQVQ